MSGVIQAMLGVVVFLGIAWVFSLDRSKMPWRLCGIALLLQFTIAATLLNVAPVRDALFSLNHVVSAIAAATMAGSSFVFGFLGGGDTPYAITKDSATFIFAFRVLPQILVFSVLVAILWHWRVLSFVVNGLSFVLQKALRVGGAEGLAAASSIFLGTIEAPLMIRPYLAKMSRSELFTVMTCGMSTVAGSVMILYANVLANIVANPLGQILTASVIMVPGAIMVARIMVPREDDHAVGDVADTLQYDSTMDAITRGTGDGIRLVVNVGAMLIVLVSLVALVNHLLEVLPQFGGEHISLQRTLGWLFAPVAWLMGIPWQEAHSAGSLLGTKLALNELVAYLQLGQLGPDAFVPRTDMIITFALCGFANLGSLGIMLGGLSAMAPERKADILELAPRSLFSGTIVNCLAGAIVGIVY